MVGKNNKTGQFRRQANEDKRYTLKKLSVGLASVALGTVLFLGQVNAVNAEEVDSDIEDNLPDDFTDEEAAERRAEEDILLTENENNAEAPAEKTVFQFSYMEAGTGKKMDGFFGEYVNANEAEKAFRMYANEAGYTLENIQFNNNSFTATIAPSSTDRYVEAAKSRARNLISGLDGLTDELKADYLEQVGAAVSVEEVEAVYNEAIEMANQQKEEANRYVAVAKDRARQLIKNLTNLTNDQKTHYLAKVEAATSVAEVEAIHAEAESVVNETPAPNRFVKIAKNHARQLINKLGNLYDNQKADYIKRVDAADSVKAIEGILEEAQKHVNSAKGGENGQAPTQPNKPSYDGEITPTPEAPAESELDQAKMKATADIKALGYFTAKEKQDLLGRVKDYGNTGDIHFIVTKAQQENEKRHQLHRKLLELQFGTNPNNSLPEAGKPQDANPGDILDPQADIERDIAKAQALEAIAKLSYFTADEISAIETDINNAETTEEVTKIVKDAQEENATRQQNHKHSIEEQLEKQPNDTLPEAGKPQDANPEDLLKPEAGESKPGTDDKQPEQPAESELDRAKAGALADIEALKNFSEKEKQDLINRVNSYDNVGDIDFIITKAQEENDKRYKANKVVEDTKADAKGYLDREFANDLTPEQRNIYAKAIDKIKNDDPDYEKKVQDILQVAIAEVLVGKAERGERIENAKKALVAASQETEGGKLIDGKQDLIRKLQERLDQVVANTEFHTLEEKTKKTLDELRNLTQQVDQAVAKDGEVDQDQLDNIQTKVTELESVLTEIQKHIHTLPTAEAQEATNMVKDIQAFLAKVRDQYSYEEVTPAEEAKESAKDYVDKGFGTDLMPERRDVYKKALDQISNDDPAYDQKVDDIIQVATAEVLVNKAEKGTHIKAAEEALAKALKTTEGGKLIADKDELIKQLQDRLAKVISDKDQVPPVENEHKPVPPTEKEKEQVPASEKEETPQESEEVKGKKQGAKEFVHTANLLTAPQKTFYTDLLDAAMSVEQITEIINLFEAEKLLTEAKTDEASRGRTIPGVTAKLANVSSKNEKIMSKKNMLQAELDKLTGKEDAPAPEVNSEEAFINKRKQVVEANQEWVNYYNTLDTNNEGKKVATREQLEKLSRLSKKALDLIAEWEEIAKGDATREQSVEGFKTTAKPQYENFPPLK